MIIQHGETGRVAVIPELQPVPKGWATVDCNELGIQTEACGAQVPMCCGCVRLGATDCPRNTDTANAPVSGGIPSAQVAGSDWLRYLSETGHGSQYDTHCQCSFCESVRREYPRWLSEHPNKD